MQLPVAVRMRQRAGEFDANFRVIACVDRYSPL
jgi:hypothetical protein